MSINVYLYHLLLFSGRMLKFQSLEVNNNKYSSDFRHTNFCWGLVRSCLSGRDVVILYLRWAGLSGKTQIGLLSHDVPASVYLVCNLAI